MGVYSVVGYSPALFIFMYSVLAMASYFSFQSTLCEAPVFLAPSSTLLQAKAEFVVFQELTESSRLFMREVTAIEASWLPALLPEHCSFSAPLEIPPPSFDDVTGTITCHMTCTYGN